MTGKSKITRNSRKILRPKRNVQKEASSVLSSETSVCHKHVFTAEEKQYLESQLLEWYDAHQRTLPWRDIAKYEKEDNKRGYAVWVSEVMLQQTQVATVIPYYKKWIQKWPTVKDLASASLEEVNQVWAGLGYYSRAKRLHEGAQLITNSHNGIIPKTMEELKENVPGIGKYTACAIASVAHQQVVGVVDGNVSRVFSRLRALGSDISKPSTQKHLWFLADETVSKSRPGDFNQALMEFGAVLCTPRNPKCSSCPLKSICAADSMIHKTSQKLFPKSSQKKTCSVEDETTLKDIENALECEHCISKSLWMSSPDVTTFPVKPQKKVSRIENIAVVVVENDGALLMIQRPETGLLAGLWEFPSIVLDNVADSHQIVTDWLFDLGISNKVSTQRKKIGEVLHIFSHIRTTYVVEHLEVDEPYDIQLSKQKTRWLNREEVASSAISTAMKKVLAAVDKSYNKSQGRCSDCLDVLNGVEELYLIFRRSENVTKQTTNNSLLNPSSQNKTDGSLLLSLHF